MSEMFKNKNQVPAVSGIYALHCPKSLEIRYIGQSVNMRRRVQSHIRGDGRSHLRLTKWIKSLHNKGLAPKITILEECDNLDQREEYWINKFGLENLCNIKEGGHQRNIPTMGGVKMPWGKMQSPAQYLLIRVRKAAEETKSEDLWRVVEDIKYEHEKIRSQGVLAWVLYNIDLITRVESLWPKYLGKIDIRVAEEMLLN